MLPSTKSFIERQDRMLSKLSGKMQTSIGRRADMYIEDSETINNDACRVMIAYAKHLGPVNTEQLETFVIREFGGSLIPNLATAQSFSDLGRVMVVLSRANVTRPMTDSKHMQQVVAGAVYLDKTLMDTWEVESNQEGQPYLRRVSSDNIGQIVAERRKRMATAGQEPLTITAAMNFYGGTMNADAGDTVKVIYKDSIHSGCTVSSVSGENITVKIPKVGSVTLSRQAVMQIEEVGKKKISHMEKELESYYKQIYGPEYAAQLTDKTTQG